MIRLISTKSLIATAIALGAVMAGPAAHARTDVALTAQQAARFFTTEQDFCIGPRVFAD